MESHFYDSRLKFGTKLDAQVVIDQLTNLARRYGFATRADLYERCEITSNYTDNEFGWSAEMLENASVVYDDNDYFTIKLPTSKHIDDISSAGKVTYRNYYSVRPRNTKPTSLPQPDILSITIHTNEVENPDEIISDVFKHITQIKDRMINITIM